MVNGSIPQFSNVLERSREIGRQAVRGISEFTRENPLISTGTGLALLGAGVGATTSIIRKRKKKRKTTRRTTVKRKRRTKVKRRSSRRRYPRRIRGKGLGTHELRHTGKGTKLVSFKTKGGKIVRFRTKGTSRRRRGFGTKRGIRR